MVELKKLSIRKPYIQKVVTLNRRTIKQYIRPEWHREFRNNHISTIRNAMLKGEHPSESITINEVFTSRITHASQKRILNGNHRIQAVREIIKEHPDFSIELTVSIYYNLTKEEEIKVYEKVNNTRKESMLDKLKAHLVGTDVLKMVEQKFPFRVLFRSLGRSDRNAITATTLFSAYIYRNEAKVAGGIKTILPAISTLGKDDYNRIFKFATFFKKVCGEPSKQNLYSSYNVYSVLGKIYYTLAGTEITEAEYETKLRKIIVRNTTDIAMLNNGVHLQKQLYLFMLDKLKGRKKLFNAYEK